MLIDDNESDNFYHKIVIDKADCANQVITKFSAIDALEYLNNIDETGNIIPDLIFLDINMPEMNGWEFLKEYAKVCERQKKGVVVVMLTTSANPEDAEKANATSLINEFKNKPLSVEMLEEITEKYFAS